jgi:hypothetical protein
MGGVRDGFSNFGFFEALAPQSFIGDSITGATIDKDGYQTLTFLMHAGEISGIASALVSVLSCGWVRMQEGVSNEAGSIIWNNVQESQILIDVKISGETLNVSNYTSASYGLLAESAAGSGLANGTVLTLGGVSADKQSFWESKMHAVGYIGYERWVRLVVSASAAGETSAIGIAATAVLGCPHNWPVNELRTTV